MSSQMVLKPVGKDNDLFCCFRSMSSQMVLKHGEISYKVSVEF